MGALSDQGIIKIDSMKKQHTTTGTQQTLNEVNTTSTIISKIISKKHRRKKCWWKKVRKFNCLRDKRWKSKGMMILSKKSKCILSISCLWSNFVSG